MNKMIGIIGMMMFATGFSLPHTAYTAGDEDVIAVNERFYEALNFMFTGEIAPMKAVWSHADDVVYMGPGGGLITGWTDVSQIWEKQAAMKLGGKVIPSDITMTVGKDMAVIYDVEVGENYNQAGELEKVSIRATNVYRKEKGQWKMIGHHTDLLPYLEKDLQ